MSLKIFIMYCTEYVDQDSIGGEYFHLIFPSPHACRRSIEFNNHLQFLFDFWMFS